MTGLLRWLAGGVRIQVRGPSVERFLNVCLRGGIDLWQVSRPAPGELEAGLSLSDFVRLRRLMGRTGCRVHLTGRQGAPFLWKRLRRRWVLLGGVAVLAAALVLLRSTVCVLEISCAPGVAEYALRDALRRAGVYEGAFVWTIDTEAVRNAVMLECPELSFLTISRVGNAVRVEVFAERKNPEMVDGDAPTGLVAGRDGVITRLEVTGGQALVEVGDVVAAGDLLVSSAVPPTTDRGTAYRAHGSGKIFARTEREVRATQALGRTYKTYTGETRTQYALIFGQKRINLYFGSGITAGTCDKIVEKTRLGIGPALRLPVTLVRQSYRFYEGTPSAADGQAQGEALAARLLEETAEEIEGEVLSHTAEIDVRPGAVEVCLRLVCEEQIGEEMIDNSPLPPPPAPAG